MNNGPKDTHRLTPQTCDCVTLYGKRHFVDLMRIWRWGDDSELFGWADVITRVLIREGKEGQNQRDVTIEAEVRVMQPQAKE